MIGENYVVKHNKLIEAKGKMTLMEQKILRTVISELQPNDRDFKEYNINVREFQELTKAKRKDMYEELKDVAHRLMDRKIEIEDITDQGQKQFFITRYISSARYINGTGVLTVKFDPDLKPYLLELKEQFTQYQLKYVMQMKSTHALRVYELLKQYETIGKRRFLLKDFKMYLGIENNYTAIKDLEKYVLKSSMIEINEQTDIVVDYQKIKNGRTIVAIEYTIYPKYKDNQKMTSKPSNELNKDQVEDVKYRSGLSEENFNSQQIIELYKIASKMAADVDPCEYIRLNYAAMEDKNTARNKFAWLKAALENDYARASFQIKMQFDVLEYVKGRD